MAWTAHGDHEFREVVTRTLTEIQTAIGQLAGNQEKILSALTDLQAADAALKAEVATFLTDVSTALQNAGAASDPAVEQVVADINAEVAALQAADPVTGTAATASAPAAPSEPAAPAAG